MAQIKAMNIRLPKEMWVFLREKSLKTESSMNGIILKYIENDMKRRGKKELQDKNSVVS